MKNIVAALFFLCTSLSGLMVAAEDNLTYYDWDSEMEDYMSVGDKMTISGNFVPGEYDVLTARHSGFREWTVTSENGTVPNFTVKTSYFSFVPEGDLDHDGGQEFGLLLRGDGFWSSYGVFTVKESEWKYLVAPFTIHADDEMVLKESQYVTKGTTRGTVKIKTRPMSAYPTKLITKTIKIKPQTIPSTGFYQSWF